MTDMTEPPLVLVTGATGGIGKATTRDLHRRGYDVSLLDLAHDPLAQLEAELNGERPGSADSFTGSASDEVAVKQWMDDALARHGRIDGLVNVAGLWRSRPIDDLGFDEIDQIITANLRTAIVCCKIVSEAMLAAGRGSIVNFASTAGEYGSISPAAHYAAAKGGVIALTKTLARELSPRGIRVNAVSPGPIDTSGLHDGNGGQHQRIADRTLLGRLGKPEEIAGCVSFLVGPDSSFITGHILRANGGSLL